MPSIIKSTCPHCNKAYANVELHITKTHSDFVLEKVQKIATRRDGSTYPYTSHFNFFKDNKLQCALKFYGTSPDTKTEENVIWFEDCAIDNLDRTAGRSIRVVVDETTKKVIRIAYTHYWKGFMDRKEGNLVCNIKSVKQTITTL